MMKYKDMAINALESFIIDLKIDNINAEKLKSLLDIESEFYKEKIINTIKLFNINEDELPILLDELTSNILSKHGKVHTIEEPFIPWFDQIQNTVEWKYWNIYKKALENKGNFSSDTIASLDESTYKILSMLFNPLDTSISKSNRRGLVVGNVQSGKTANYIGLVAKSMDIGFKTIFIITGVHEVLRTQTYTRIVKELGTNGIHYYTSQDDDFKGIQSRFIANLDSSEDRHIFIIKKNTKVLENINKFLSINHVDKIISPMLFIDDEADNASINTKESEDPTTTNRHIRDILNRFHKKSYIGYTATPYANVFIDKDITHKNYEDDLFPKDFIVALPISNQYCGIDTYKGTESTTLYQIIEEDHELEKFYSSIDMFVLSTAIRNSRKDFDHNSMLIHISSRIAAHKEIVGVVYDYLDKLKNEIYDPNKSLYIRLRQLYVNEYLLKTKLIKPDFHDIWENIESEIENVLLSIEVKMINSDGDNLDYNDTLKTYIIIGGSKLSRGLTLEGLTISFFDRKSKQFDTLMQMGRWFGYKKRYIDVCRVISQKETLEHFDAIGESDKYLRDEIELMRSSNITPKDYAVKVLGHYNLLPTSRKKMNTIYKFGGLSGKTRETLRFKEESNIISINNYLVDLTSRTQYITNDDNLLWLNVDFSEIKQFFKIYNFHHDESNMNKDLILKYIQQFHSESLFNIALRLPKNARGEIETIFENKIHFSSRTCLNEAMLKRFLGPNDEIVDLDYIYKNNNEYFENKSNSLKSENDSTSIRFKEFKLKYRENPLLVLLPATIEIENKNLKFNTVGFGISFPEIINEVTNLYINY